ncbi:phage tail tip lysozyme [Bradyrhizobium sp. SSUT77]|uniref:beta strand repeat-containing protein n=1 Tax=Bradyrhizobium sp. SSUT77 TaxID=3040603 RepID=UPI0024481C37|nr:phage tail tip lysozyme [Bradyrhizobium sp. SSUT77]MDH2344191.1 phage tail tip lysozyme [Bradyrhizobium sp. SSUT77]
MASPISYDQFTRSLTTPDGELTPTGIRAMQLFNTYTDAGLPPIAAAQVIGGQLIEDPNLNPLQVERQSTAYQPDAQNLDLMYTLSQYPNSPGNSTGVGLSQWTTQSRKDDLSNYLSGQDPNGSAFDASSQFTIHELQDQGLIKKFNNVDASSPAESTAAYNAQQIALTQYERPSDQAIPGVNFQNRLNAGTAVYDIAMAGGSDQVALAGGPDSSPQGVAYVNETQAAETSLGAMSWLQSGNSGSPNVLSPDAANGVPTGAPTTSGVSYLQQGQEFSDLIATDQLNGGLNDMVALNQSVVSSANQTYGTVGQDFTDLQNSSSWSQPSYLPSDNSTSLGSQSGSSFSDVTDTYMSGQASSPITDPQSSPNWGGSTQRSDLGSGDTNFADVQPSAPAADPWSGQAQAYNDYGYSSQGSYNVASADTGGYSDYGGDFGGGDSSIGPVMLDLSGKGINITQLSSSNVFFDSTGSGVQNQTAWAGTGSGVLFYDSTGTGQLTQANQAIFTDWDPSAKSDMQALLDVFDTNHDGALDSGDANFSKFYVMVTNADGTRTAKSLATLGIASINLNQDATHVAQPDGSSIDGQTTYTTTSGTTGTAATVTLATDANGYVVTNTTTTNADGSVTTANTASNADGSVDHQRILNSLVTSAVSSGVTTTTTAKELATVNNGGVVLTLQTDNISSSTNGTTSETLVNYSAGAITSTGELTSAGTSNSEKLNATTTTTVVASGGAVVTILRDQLGGGWTTQKEVDSTTSASGPATYVISNVNSDGSVSHVTSSTVVSGGLTRTTVDLVDGSSTMATTVVDATVVASGGTRTETVTTSAGSTVTSLVQTVTSTTSNTVTRTTSSDLTDGVTLNRTSVDQTVTNSGGSVTTSTDRSANNTLLDQIVTSQTPQSSGGLVTSAVTSQLDNGAFIVVDNRTTTISNAGGTQTTTIVDNSANGTQRSKSINSTTLGSAARTTTIYGNGDGKITQYETVTVSSGTTTDTAELLNGNGSLKGEVVTTTTSGGLAKTIKIDSTGSGTVAAPVFDHITTDNTTTSAGTSTETVTHFGSSTSYKIDQSQIVVTSGGLETIVSSAFVASSLASAGTWDQVSTDLTTISAGGALSETLTVTDGAGHTLETVQTNTAANRQLVTRTTALGTTGLVKQVETVTLQNNGTVQDQSVNFDQQGDVLGATLTTTTADGLVRTVKTDIQGQTAAVYSSSGLAFDRTTTATTTINSDGSRSTTANTTSQNGTLLSTSTTSATANGLTATTTLNPYATTHYATKTTAATTLNADGSSTQSVTDYSYNATKIDSTQTVTAAGRLGSTVSYDLDGDGVTDRSTTDMTTVNADGSRTEVVTDYTGTTTGTVRDVTTVHSGIIVTSAGLETTITRQSNGSVATYQSETILPGTDGSTTDTTDYFTTSGGALLLRTIATTNATGLTKTVATAVNGDTTADFSTTDATVLNADGSRTETISSSNKSGLLDETVTITSGNGLSITTKVDANGALNGSSPIFNLVTTDNTVLNRTDGSRTETVSTFNANGGMTTQTVTTVSADKQTISANRYFNETGTISTVDQTETTQTQANGSIVDTLTSYDSNHALLGTIVKTASGNGLSVQMVYKNGAGTTDDTQSETTTYDSNGDGGRLIDWEDTDVVNATTLKTSVKTQISGNAQTKLTTMVLTGALSQLLAQNATVTTNDSVAIDDFGNTTETVAVTTSGYQGIGDTQTIVTSANGLSTTSTVTLAGQSAALIQETKVTALDGSKTDTTTYFNSSTPSFIERQDIVSTSFDGRTISETSYRDYDGSQYNIVTDTFVKNADNTTTETRTGSGSFGSIGFTQTITTSTNADASKTVTTINYDPTGWLTVGQIVADVSGNGLSKSFVYDTTGLETLANLNSAATAILNGGSLPSSLLSTDIVASDITTLNVDGSKTEAMTTAYGNSFANLRSESIKTTSANGLTTVTKVDNNGNGIFNQVDTTTVGPDGSKTEVSTYYGDTTATANTILGINTYSVSANGLVSTLANSQGVTDTTVVLPSANGSYEWSRTVVANSPEAVSGVRSGTASHIIDANGIDTWTVSDGYTRTRTITIDVATEKQDVAIANEIYRTLLGRSMDNSETQHLINFIDAGRLDRVGLANGILLTTGYQSNYGVPGPTPGTFYWYGFDVTAAFQNAFGRLPTALEMGTFGQFVHDQAPTPSELANMAVAVAQYAADRGAEDNRTLVDGNQDLVSTAPQWINPASKIVSLTTSGTYAYSGQWLEDGNLAAGTGGVAVTVNGNSNVVLALNGSNLTLNGYNNAVDIPGVTATINAFNAAITVEDGGIATVSGNNNQIAQVGPTSLTLTSGTGDQIFVGSGSTLSGFAYTSASPITQASNATITIGPNVGTYTDPAQIIGNNDLIYVETGAYVEVSGSNEIINVLGSGTAVVFGSVSSSQIVDGGLIQVASGGSASNTTILSGGDLAVFGGASVTGVTLQSGGYFEIGSGFTESSFVVPDGGILQVDSGGTVSGTTVSSGGMLILGSGAIANGTIFTSGSYLQISAGYTLSNYTASNGVTLDVGSGGTVNGATVTSGNAITVANGGVASNVSVNNGGSLTLYGAVDGASAVAGANVTIGNGGVLSLSAGQSLQGGAVQNGGLLALYSGGTANGTVVSSGGAIEVFGGATTSNLTLTSGAVYYVGSGASLSNTTVSAGQTLGVTSGASISGTTVSSGGVLELFGGTATSATIKAGGQLLIEAGATQSGYIVSSGVVEGAFSGAVVSNVTVNSGGELDVWGTVNGATSSNGTVFVGSGGVLNLASGQTVNGGAVLTGGTLVVSSGATAGNTLVSSGGQLTTYGTVSGASIVSGGNATVAGGTFTVTSGQTDWNVSVTSVGKLVVSSGATVSNTVVDGGGQLIVDGTVVNASIVSGGAVVSSGGLLDIGGFSVSGVTVSNGGTLLVDSGGVGANVTVSSGGTLGVYNADLAGANILSGSVAVISAFGEIDVGAGQTVSGVKVAGDGLLTVASGGSAVGTVVSSGGTLELFTGASATGTTVSSGGIVAVGAGDTLTGYTIASGTTLEVLSGGTTNGAIVSSGGTLEVFGGGNANSAGFTPGSYLEIVGGVTSGYSTNANCTLEVGSGETLNGATINSGTALDVLYGGTLTNATVSSGGTLVADGAVFGVNQVAGGTVSVGAWGNLNVLSGQTVRGVSVANAGAMVISSGGVASGTTVAAGGQLLINGVASGANVAAGGSVVVSSGGTLNVLSGQTDQGVLVVAGGTMVVSSGGTAINAAVSSGGVATVSAGGTDSGTSVYAGGAEIIRSGGKATSTTVGNSGTETVSSGGTASGGTVTSGGQAYVLSGGSVVGDSVLLGGTLTVSSGGVASGTQLLGNQVVIGVASGTVVLGGPHNGEYVESGGTAINAIVSSGGTEAVYSGLASGTTVYAGGVEFELAGGTVSATQLKGGTNQVSGTANSTIVSSGGLEMVLSGGIANAATVLSGGIERILISGTAKNTTISSGGAEVVSSGGVASGTIVSSGGSVTVSAGGIDSGTKVYAGGSEIVSSGGTATSTTVAGTQSVKSGGTTLGAVVSSGGSQIVLSGGSASGTIVSSGGTETISAGGIASSTYVSAGGLLYVSSGGVASGATVGAGTLEVASGGSVGASVGFTVSAGGTLTLDSSQAFTGSISGFGQPEHIDLVDIAYNSSTTLSFAEAASNTSGTLTVSDGVHTAHVTLLGQYVTAQFTSATDGHGGTLIGDPPIHQAATVAKESSGFEIDRTSSESEALTPIEKFLRSAQSDIAIPGPGGRSFLSEWFDFATSHQPPGGASNSGVQLETDLSRLISAIAGYEGAGAGPDPAALSQTSQSDTTVQRQLAAAWHG